MASGLALGYVQDDTASQILCQILTVEQWERLLESRVGRRPMGTPGAGCEIATRLGRVHVRFEARDAAFTPSTTVAGRPATVEKNAFGSAEITVALTDDALRPAPRQYYPVRRLVRLQMVGYPGSGQDIGTRVLEEIVPLLAKEGESLPEIAGDGHVPYASTPLTEGDDFVDMPRPVQALQLCTLVTRAAAGAKVVEVFDDGECKLRIGQEMAVVSADHIDRPADYPLRIAGRPARTLLDPPVVHVRLRDDAEVELYVSAPDSVALAEKLVPKLMG